MKPCNRGAEMGAWIVPELRDLRMAVERLLHDSPLDTPAAAVNEPHLEQARFGSRGDVLFDDRRDVARRERVEVEGVLERDAVGHVWMYVAVTWVVMPPLAEKLPMTVMRRGARASTRSSRIWLVAAS